MRLVQIKNIFLFSSWNNNRISPDHENKRARNVKVAMPLFCLMPLAQAYASKEGIINDLNTMLMVSFLIISLIRTHVATTTNPVIQ